VSRRRSCRVLISPRTTALHRRTGWRWRRGRIGSWWELLRGSHSLLDLTSLAFAASSLARRGYCVTSRGGVSLSEERGADWGRHRDTSSRSEMDWKSKKQSFIDRGGVYGALPSAEGVGVVGGFLGRPWCFGTGIDGGKRGYPWKYRSHEEPALHDHSSISTYNTTTLAIWSRREESNSRMCRRRTCWLTSSKSLHCSKGVFIDCKPGSQQGVCWRYAPSRAPCIFLCSIVDSIFTCWANPMGCFREGNKMRKVSYLLGAR
jgi:hypothetical protein